VESLEFCYEVFDFWVPDHFKKLCSAIDMLPANYNFDISELDSELRYSLKRILNNEHIIISWRL
jgi:hypothetical protein